jgi:hypothetical protein
MPSSNDANIDIVIPGSIVPLFGEKFNNLGSDLLILNRRSLSVEEFEM